MFVYIFHWHLACLIVHLSHILTYILTYSHTEKKLLGSRDIKQNLDDSERVLCRQWKLS